MSSQVTIVCDRCGASVDGLRTDSFTSGFYNVAPSGAWAKYGRPGESEICDSCMHADPAYRRDYSHDAAASS